MPSPHRRRIVWLTWLLAAFPVPLATAQAALPDVVKPPSGINLGSTSFYDGFGRLRPGITILQYFRWSHNTAIDNAAGAESPLFVQPRIEAFPALTQFIVASKWRPFGGAAGFSVLVPFVGIDTSFAADSPKTLSATGFGMGDILAGPSYQSKFFLRTENEAGSPKPRQSESGPFFAYRCQFLVQIPTGRFNSAKSVNPGNGYWAVIPYLAATYLPTHRVEMSTRLHYQYNRPTDMLGNPPPIPHLVYHSGQAGQLVYGNFTGSYRLTRKLYLGANSYGVYQLSPDKTNGINVGHARETQFFLGPGGGFDFNKSNTLNVNLYLKVEAHNTANGPSLQLFYIHKF